MLCGGRGWAVFVLRVSVPRCAAYLMYVSVSGSWGARVRSAVVVGEVNVLADNNSYRTLGTAVQKMMGKLDGGLSRLRICKFSSKCGKLVCNGCHVLASGSFSKVLARNNAVLKASERPFGLVHIPSRGNLSGIRTVGRACCGLYLSYLIVLNKGNARGATGLLERRKLGVVRLPGAVSGSVCNASVAFNFRDTMGVTAGTVSYVRAATSSRKHMFVMRVVKRGMKDLALRTNITNNTSVVLVPRVPCSVGGIATTVRGHTGTNGHFAVLTITRNTVSGRSTRLPGGGCGRELRTQTGGCPSISCRVTSRVCGRVKDRIHIAIPKRARENKRPYPCSHILSAEVNTNTTRTVVSNRCNVVVNIMGNGVGHMPLRRYTNGLGVMSPGSRLMITTGRVNVDFNS